VQSGYAVTRRPGASHGFPIVALVETPAHQQQIASGDHYTLGSAVWRQRLQLLPRLAVICI